MRLKELRGLPVIDPTAARKVGTVTDYQVDPVGVASRPWISTRRPERWRAHPRASHPPRRSARRHPDRSRCERAALALDDNERWLESVVLEGLEVLGDDGDRIGRLVDASFDQDSLDIESYLLRSGFLGRLIGRRGRSSRQGALVQPRVDDGHQRQAEGAGAVPADPKA